MTLIFTVDHKQQISKCVETQLKKFLSYVEKKIKSTEAIPALDLADGTYATKNMDKAETLKNVFSPVFTNEIHGDWDVVKQHVNKVSDDLSKLQYRISIDKIFGAGHYHVYGS